MKCQFLLILFSLALSPTAFAQFVGGSYKDATTKGKIDSIAETTYVINIDTADRTRFTKFVYTYNGKGQLVKLTVHTMNDYFTLITFYSYDDARYIKEKQVKEKDQKIDTLSLYSKATYIYGPSHQWVRVDRHLTSKDKPVFPSDFTDYIDLDPSGKVLKDSSFYFGTSQITRRHNYRYNTRGDLVELDDAEGSLGIMPSKTFFTYDDNGDIIKEERTAYRGTYNNIKTLVKTYIRTYNYFKLDNKHNWLVKKDYNEGKLERVTERRIVYRK